MLELTVEPEKAQDAPEVEAPVDATTVTLVEEDLLVEDVSIDGMCGVY